ncbi:MAG: hypothetical protein LC620_03985, partial [Halobacteriales archaeon]|nr:hypothetical protein [Halobacteriales archaeon]
SYAPLKTLAEARAAPDGVVILQGDDGGQIYVVAPARLVACTEGALQTLLVDLDQTEWRGNDPSSRSVYFERLEPGRGVWGGMGGGRVEPDVWIHADLHAAGLADRIREVLGGRRPRVFSRGILRSRAISKARAGEKFRKECLDALLEYDLQDFITPWEVHAMAKEHCRGADAQRRLALEVVAYGLRRGLVMIGDVEGGFRPWPVKDVNEAVARMERAWVENESEPMMLGFWLDRTEQGWVHSYWKVAQRHPPVRAAQDEMFGLLIRGLDGPVRGPALAAAGEAVAAQFKETNFSQKDPRAAASHILYAILNQGFAQIGTMEADGFQALPANQVYAGKHLSRLLDGELVLRNTEKGNQAGRTQAQWRARSKE